MSNSITLNTYTNGDTQYVAKLNNDSATVSNAINNLLASVGAGSGAASYGNLLLSLFGFNATVIGNTAYGATQSGSNLQIAPGYCWKPSTTSLLQSGQTASISFSGQSAGTYYVSPDNLGNPTLQNGAMDAIQKVVWSGSAFSSVTRVANVFFDSSAETSLLTSTQNATVYATLLARLESIELAIKAVATASSFGVVKPDGTTITVAGGVLTAAASSVAFQTNGTANSLQTKLNLIAGTNITLASDSSGGVTVTGAAGLPSAGAASQFLASTGSGSAYAARLLASADIPNNAANTTGTASNVTGTVALANGGTGSTTASAALSTLGALPLVGGTLTGPLVLSGNPATGSQAANKSYVDSAVSGAVTQSGSFPNSTAAGQFLVSNSANTNAYSPRMLASGDIPNNAANTTGTAGNVTGTVAIANGGTGATTASGALSSLGALPLAGGTLTGPLVLSGSPTASGQAANKSYVDAGDQTNATAASSAQSTANAALPASGGAMSGTFSGNPTFSGSPSFNGNPVYSGTPNFTGTPTVKSFKFADGTSLATALAGTGILLDVSAQNTGSISNSFTKISFTSVNTDSASGWSTMNNVYTTPVSGVYMIVSKLRVVDGSTANISYGQGVGTTAGDSPTFTWFATAMNANQASARNGSSNTRIARFAGGAQIQMFAYADSSLSLAAVAMNIVLLATP